MQNAPDRSDQIHPRAAGAVHDFNNLLSVIMVCADEIAAMPGEGDHHARAEEIRTAAGRGAELIRELLAPDEVPRAEVEAPAPVTAELRSHERAGEKVRVSRGPDASEAAEIRLEAAITSTLPLLERTLGGDVALRTSFDAELPPVGLPKETLERIFLNLAANSRAAFDETDSPSRSVVIQASLVAVRDGDPLLGPGWYVRTAFSDNGGGMDFEVAARALEPGFSTKRESGTGLGLSIVRQIVREAGGDVRLNTTPGVGTTITLYLPTVEAVAAARDAEEDGREQSVRTDALT